MQKFKRTCPLYIFPHILSEPPVRLSVRNLALCPLKPASPRILLKIEFRNIRLNIQKRRPVQDVHVFNMQYPFINSSEADHGQADRIRAFRGAGGKNAPRLGVHEWNDVKFKALTTMEVIQQNNVGESFEILQSCLNLFKNLDSTLYPCGTGRLDRHALRVGKWRVDDTDQFKFNIHYMPQKK